MAATQHHLVVLPLHGPLTAAEAVRALRRLERAGSLVTVDSVVVDQREDGTRHIAAPSPSAPGALDLAAWTWLIEEALERSGARRPPSGLSESFALEVGTALRSPGASLAFIVSRLDADAAVAELRGFPATRLISGALPDRMLERMWAWPKTSHSVGEIAPHVAISRSSGR